MKRLIRKYKWLIVTSIFTLVVVLLLGTHFFFRKEIMIKEYKNEYYTFQYDSSWKLEENDKKEWFEIMTNYLNGIQQRDKVLLLDCLEYALIPYLEKTGLLKQEMEK